MVFTLTYTTIVLLITETYLIKKTHTHILNEYLLWGVIVQYNILVETTSLHIGSIIRVWNSYSDDESFVALL